MTVEVTCIDPTMNLSFVWTVMKELGVRHLPIVDGEKLVGILSHRDMMLHGQPKNDGTLEFPDKTAAQAMTTTLRTATANATVSQVAELMVKHRISSVPVIDVGSRLVGLVTSTDLLKLLIEPGDADRALPFHWAIHKRAR